MVRINDKIGNYTIIEESNSGGFGSVYKAKHIVFDDDPPVAIKVLHPHLIALQQHQLFFQEACLLKKLRHKYILPLLDAGSHEGSLYIITEYATLGSLHDRIQQRNGQPFPLDEAISIVTQIGEALQHAHEERVTHCDIKPENILFNAKGEALLADFGLATVLNSTSIVYTDSVVRTFAYMAPEQFRGDISIHSDQYSLACIAYELVAGRKPFIVPPVHPAIVGEIWKHKHIEETPISPTQFNAIIPLYITEGLFRAMSKECAQRYFDVISFVRDLQAPPKRPKSKLQWLEKGNSLWKLKRYADALQAYEQAFSTRHNVAMMLDRYDEALWEYERTVLLDPNYALAYNNKGNALYNLKRYEEALQAYKQVLCLDPNNALAYNNMGITLSSMGRTEEAQQAYTKAKELGYEG